MCFEITSTSHTDGISYLSPHYIKKKNKLTNPICVYVCVCVCVCNSNSGSSGFSYLQGFQDHLKFDLWCLFQKNKQSKIIQVTL